MNEEQLEQIMMEVVSKTVTKLKSEINTEKRSREFLLGVLQGAADDGCFTPPADLDAKTDAELVTLCHSAIDTAVERALREGKMKAQVVVLSPRGVTEVASLEDSTQKPVLH